MHTLTIPISITIASNYNSILLLLITIIIRSNNTTTTTLHNMPPSFSTSTESTTPAVRPSIRSYTATLPLPSFNDQPRSL
jgi:hypothetical protein